MLFQRPWDVCSWWEASGVSCRGSWAGEQTHLRQTTQIKVRQINVCVNVSKCVLCFRYWRCPFSTMAMSEVFFLSSPAPLLSISLHRYNGEVGDMVVGRIIEVCRSQSSQEYPYFYSLCNYYLRSMVCMQINLPSTFCCVNLFLTGFQVQQKRWKVETFSRLDSVLLLSSVNLPGGVLVSPVAMVTTKPCARSQGVPSLILRSPSLIPRPSSSSGDWEGAWEWG